VAKGIGRLYKRGRYWWAKYYPVPGKPPVLESTRCEGEKEAGRFLRERIEQCRKPGFNPRAERVSFDDLWVGLEDDYRTNKRRSMASLGTREKPLHEFFGRMSALAITAAEVAKYKRARLAEGKANGTVNREMAALRRAFAIAIENGLLTSAPKITMLQEAPPREGFLTHADFLAVQEHLPSDVKDFAAFLYLSGWRINEARTLNWSNVDLDAREITLQGKHSKNKMPRTLALEGELLAIVERAHERRLPGLPVFWYDHYHRSGERARPQPIGRFPKTWAKACEAAGRPGLLIHDFRRSAVRNYTRAGVPEAVVMRMTGHKTRSVFDRYNIVAQDDIKAAVTALDKYLGGQPTAPKVVRLHKEGK